MIRSLLFFLLIVSFTYANGCLECHKGLESIRDESSLMMQEILAVATKAGEPGNDCIVCHGGDPKEKKKELAHNSTPQYFLNHEGPKNFYPSPTSPWINKNTCGMCHKEQVKAQYSSLMMSEAGKIQGTLWGFGGLNGYKHNIANFDINASLKLHEKLGTKEYNVYMKKVHASNAQLFPKSMKELPNAPTADEVQKNPQLAAYTYMRQECQRCHIGSSGGSRHFKGEYRGIGCAACHIPYSNSGLYEGKDKSISKMQQGHLLIHRIQSTRKAKVHVNDINYSGIPVETCTTCHNRGKRIGVSYQGLMESAYQSTWMEDGSAQPKLHGKRYLHMKSDIHLQKGMLCQDCHTSSDAHGDGMAVGTTLAAVEIECQDCHGTTKKYPWELPLGYSDEHDTKPAIGRARGVTKSLQEYLKKATVYEPKEGYLLSARGNALVNAVREKNNTITVYLASGKDINLMPLKKLKKEEKLSEKALVAMDQVSIHTDRLECYTCHATWAPQCYGCHVKLDYSGGKQNVDWLKAAHDRDIHGTTGDMRGNLKEYLVDGKVTETRSFLRFEDPPLSQNGEGRISPTIPGCQTTVTVIGKDGKTLLQNHVFKIPNVEGAAEEGQLAIDMSPVQPHTVQKEARSCESCHASKKAMGLGIEGGMIMANPGLDHIVDIENAEGKQLSKNAKVHIAAVKNQQMDWSKFVDENGTQLQTVGHHYKLSAPLSSEQRAKLDRSDVCISCHKILPDKTLAVSAIHHIAQMAGVKIDKKEHDSILNKLLHISAWVQVVGLIVILSLVVYLLAFYRRRK